MYLVKGYKNLNNISRKTKLYWFCCFWLLIAFFEFFQDFIASKLHNGRFELFESLSYKLFWLLFIPFTWGLIYGVKKLKAAINKPSYFILLGAQVLMISFFHLIIFSVFLFGVSQLIHETNTWRLSWLITEKFSNRLYIALSIYLVIVLVYFWLKQIEIEKPEKEYAKTISVKNGGRSVVVIVETIKWISSDGPYLFLHTSDSKHILSGSLKNIITILPENFKRIHRSTIVNINMIKELRSRMNGDYDVNMNDGTILRLSRNYTKPLKGLLLKSTHLI